MRRAFLDLCGTFNTALWPAVILLWLASAWVTINMARPHPRSAAIPLGVVPDLMLLAAAVLMAIAAVMPRRAASTRAASAAS